MGFFDFLLKNPWYQERPAAVERLNIRHQMLIAPWLSRISGARVLDLGAHDGRWAYAFAAAGASSVVAVEPRGDVLKRLETFPEAEFAARIEAWPADATAALDELVNAGEAFDIVAIFGLFYHVMDHGLMLRQARALSPSLIVIDSEFVVSDNPVIQLVRERTEKPLNAVPQHPGQARAIKGIPSLRAMEEMADAFALDLEWADLSPARSGARVLKDYAETSGVTRAICALTPR